MSDQTSDKSYQAVQYKLDEKGVMKVVQRSGSITVLNSSLPPLNQQFHIIHNGVDQSVKRLNNPSQAWLLLSYQFNGQPCYSIVNGTQVVTEDGSMEIGSTVKVFLNGNEVSACISFLSEMRDVVEKQFERITNVPPVLHQQQQQPQQRVPEIKLERVIVARTSQNPSNKPLTFEQQTQTENRSEFNIDTSNVAAQLSTVIQMQQQHGTILMNLVDQYNQIARAVENNRITSENLSRQMNVFSSNITIEAPVSSENPQSSYVCYEQQKPIDEHTSEPLIIDERIEEEQQVSPIENQDHINEVIVDSSTTPDNITMQEDKNGMESAIVEYSFQRNGNKEHDMYPVLPNEEEDDTYIYFGHNKTKIKKEIFKEINWGSYKAATRKLLITCFTREVLASHSLTGRPSPAFHDRNRPPKDKLNPSIIADIVYTVHRRCRIQESLVRTAITTKCADENKMSRQRKQKLEESKRRTLDNSNEMNVTLMEDPTKPENKENDVSVLNTSSQ